MTEKLGMMFDTITIRYPGGNSDRELDEFLQQLAEEKSAIKLFRNTVVENERLIVIGWNFRENEVSRNDIVFEIVFQLGQMGLLFNHDSWEEHPSA